jgi:RNA methyltransferase, TrmH family
VTLPVDLAVAIVYERPMTGITSLQNPTVKLVRSLAEKKRRKELGLFMAEGRKVLERARREDWEPDYVLATSAPEDWGKAQRFSVDDKVMAALSSQNNPQDEIAVFRQRWAARPEPKGVWVALEDMRDPGNLGTIIRTADAAGAAGVILAGDSCDPWGPDCVRATMGSIFAVPLVRMQTAALADLCRAWPGEVVGTHLGARQSYRRPYAPPTLLVMGSEGRGLSDTLAAACSTLVRIPMNGGTESLNVAIATALMLYETVAAKPASTPAVQR